MAVHRCPTCGIPVEWIFTRHGRRLPFDAMPILIEEDPDEQGWITGQWDIGKQRRLALAPITDYRKEYRAGAKRVVRLHDQCAEYRDRIEEVLGKAD